MTSFTQAEGEEILAEMVRRHNLYPEMLEALQGILDPFSEWEGPEEGGTKAQKARNRKNRAYNAVLAVIAKARGDKP